VVHRLDAGQLLIDGWDRLVERDALCGEAGAHAFDHLGRELHRAEDVHDFFHRQGALGPPAFDKPLQIGFRTP